MIPLGAKILPFVDEAFETRIELETLELCGDSRVPSEHFSQTLLEKWALDDDRAEIEALAWVGGKFVPSDECVLRRFRIFNWWIYSLGILGRPFVGLERMLVYGVYGR
jgi:hypothetical protein